MTASFPSAERPRRAVVVTFDRLPATILGCYGNEWIETPHLDRLAAAGIAADHCFAAAVGPQTAESAFAATSALAHLQERTLSTVMIQETGEQIDFSATHFHTVQSLSGECDSAVKPDQIPLANLVRAAKNAWQLANGSKTDSLLWLHARGLIIPAQPPAGFAELYQDEFEDRGVKFDELSETDRQSHPSVAAGMMSLFDHWLGELFQAIHASESAAEPTLIIVTAAQGAPWQPHPDSLGPLDELRSQSVQPPLILHALRDDRLANLAGLRSNALLSTADVGPLLEWWFSGNRECDPLARCADQHQDRVITRSAHGWTRVSTTEWGAILPATADESSKPALFHKPEDHWEVNNVAGMFPDVIAGFSGL